MNPCRRRVLYTFGGLFLIAALFVPYRSTRVSLNRDPHTNLVWQHTARDGGYMFLFRFLRRSGEDLTNAAGREARYALRRGEDITSIRYDLNGRRLSCELGAIGLLMVFDCFFLCRGHRTRQE